MEWVGCSDADVDAVRASQRGISLPIEYESFLRVRGRGPATGSYLVSTGEHWYYPAVLDFLGIANELFEQGTGSELPAGLLVVNHYQGFQFLCVDVVGPQPLRLLRYIETHPALEQLHTTLSAALASVIAADDAGPPYRTQHVGGGVYRVVLSDDTE